MRCSTWRLYAIIDRAAIGRRDALEVTAAAIRGGADVIQWRDKAASSRQLAKDVARLLLLTKAHNIPLIVNDHVEIAREINSLPASTPKYVVVEADGVLVRGIPMPAQTVIFMTNTYEPEDQAAKNVHYLLPSETGQIPPGAAVFYIR